MYEIIKLHLKTGDYFANLDKVAFTDWANRRITLDRCIDHFKSNNGIDPEFTFSKFEFERWLNSLGYYRKG